MNISEKLTEIAENQQGVYDAGLEAGRAEGGYNEGLAAGIEQGYEQGKQEAEAVISSLIDRSVTKIVIPDGVTKVGAGAFFRTASLEEVIVPEGVTVIETYAFGACTNLKRITLPNTLTTIQNDSFGSAGSASGIDEFIIPDSVISIGYNAFSGSGVKKFVVSKNLTTIQEGTFTNCKKCMVYDFSKHERVPVLGQVYSFNGIPADCRIYVPESLYDEWIIATNWVQYADRIVAV